MDFQEQNQAGCRFVRRFNEKTSGPAKRSGVSCKIAG